MSAFHRTYRHLRLPTVLIIFSVLASSSASAQAATCDGKTATVTGTEGNDNSLAGTSGPDVIVGLGGDDVINALEGDDLVCAGPGNDEVYGGDGQDILRGEEGFDPLRGEGGDDLLDGGPDRDAAAFLNAPGPVTASLMSGTSSGEGVDTLMSIEDLVGSQFDDVLTGDAGANGLSGFFGNDVLDGGEGDSDNASYLIYSLLFPGIPASVFANLASGSALEPGGGTDTLIRLEVLIGTPYGDSLSGDRESNVLTGLGGNDELWGRGGSDVLGGDEGADGLFGGEGFDIIEFVSADSPVDVDLAEGSASQDAETDTILSVEVVVGSPFNDSLKGDAGENILAGGGGDDLIDGREGLDTADYSISTNAGGGVNTDTGPVHANLSDNTAWNFSDEGQTSGDALMRIEELWGSDRNDVLHGDADPNILQGFAGKDTLIGGGGDDAFNSGPGNDQITGGPGDSDFAYYIFDSAIRTNLGKGSVALADGTDHLKTIEIVAGSSEADVMLGSKKSDFLIGDAGADILRGLKGDDTLMGDEGANKLDGGPGKDSCVGKPSRHCESARLPAVRQAELDRAQEIVDRDDRLRKGLRLRF